MGGKFKLEGVGDLQKTLAKLADQVPEAVAEAAVDEMRAVLDDAQALAPKQTGRLRASGEVDADGDEVQVGFTAPYALVVHERAGGKGFKFLERAVLGRVKQIGDGLADAAGDAAEKAV